MHLGYIIVYVADVEAALAFYERAFGIGRRFLHPSGDFGETEMEGARLAFTSHALGATAVPVAYSPLDPQASPVGVELTLIAADVDAAFAEAVAHGATPLKEPQDEPWGQRVSYVRDPFGVLVGIATAMD